MQIHINIIVDIVVVSVVVVVDIVVVVIVVLVAVVVVFLPAMKHGSSDQVSALQIGGFHLSA